MADHREISKFLNSKNPFEKSLKKMPGAKHQASLALIWGDKIKAHTTGTN